MFGQTDIVKLLAKLNADVNAACYNGVTALVYAAGCGHAEVVKLRAELNADVNHHACGSGTALFGAS